MAEIHCRACERLLDIEPVKCPYCQSLQRAGGGGRERPVAESALALLLGGLAGVSLGYRAVHGVVSSEASSTARASSDSSVQEENFDQVQPADFEKLQKGFRLRVQAAWSALRREGRYRYVGVEDAIVEGSRLEGSRIALGGFANWLALMKRPPIFGLCTAWGSGACLAIDASRLTDEQRKEIQRNYFPPTNYFVKGTLRRGAMGNIQGTVSSYHLQVDDIVDLGHSPPGANTKTVGDYIPHPVLQ